MLYHSLFLLDMSPHNMPIVVHRLNESCGRAAANAFPYMYGVLYRMCLNQMPLAEFLVSLEEEEQISFEEAAMHLSK